MSVQELRKERAKKLRYKKPIAKGLNWQQQSAVSCRMFIILRVMDN